jgi:hypothetical protein
MHSSTTLYKAWICLAYRYTRYISTIHDSMEHNVEQAYKSVLSTTTLYKAWITQHFVILARMSISTLLVVCSVRNNAKLSILSSRIVTARTMSRVSILPYRCVTARTMHIHSTRG